MEEKPKTNSKELYEGFVGQFGFDSRRASTRDDLRSMQAYEKTGVFRTGNVEYDRSCDHFFFYLNEHEPEAVYFMPRYRVCKPADYRWFTEHIDGKRFFDDKTLSDFAKCFAAASLALGKKRNYGRKA